MFSLSKMEVSEYFVNEWKWLHDWFLEIIHETSVELAKEASNFRREDQILNDTFFFVNIA